MLPKLQRNGLLPSGIHEVSWAEFEETFARNWKRRELAAGLKEALLALALAGCRRAYVDGSFVTSKELPNDWDGCWDTAGVDAAKLDPVLLDFKDARRAQKERFGGEMFPAGADATGAQEAFLDFFQHTRDGRSKGIVAFDLTALLPTEGK
jgi:hypothetical protein